jgi:hypothetical protein
MQKRGGSRIATVAGVDEAKAGLAPGLNDASFQIGGALGVAILASVAVAHADGSDPLAALTTGFQSAFAAAVVIAVAGILDAATLLGTSRRTRSAVPEPAPA